jgi:hypothetical protein
MHAIAPLCLASGTHDVAAAACVYHRIISTVAAVAAAAAAVRKQHRCDVSDKFVSSAHWTVLQGCINSALQSNRVSHTRQHVIARSYFDVAARCAAVSPTLFTAVAAASPVAAGASAGCPSMTSSWRNLASTCDVYAQRYRQQCTAQHTHTPPSATITSTTASSHSSQIS